MLDTTQSPAADFHADFLAPLSAVQPPRGPILVASDTSAASDAAFPLARVIARHTGAGAEVFSALRPNAMPTYAFDAVPYPVPPSAELVEHRAGQVAQQLERFVPDAERALWPVAVRSGDPVREIARRARDVEARLIVVGRGRHGLLERMVGGESVLRLLQLGETPVLAVEHTLEQLPRRVVVAVDFSAFSVYATQVALTVCAPNAVVELVHVAPNLTEHAPVLRQFAEQYRAQAAASFRAFVARVQQPGITFETTLLEGNASTRLVELLTIQPADLIVTATHGYGFLRRLMLGSVAAELVRSAPCSVLCVPGTARTRAAARAESVARQLHVRIVPTDGLDRELSAFTERHPGHPCTVEVTQPDIGSHAIGHHLELAGISYEPTGRTLTLMFGASAEPGRHLAHQIHDCTMVEVVTDAAGGEQMLRMTHGRGSTTVQLE